MKRKLDLEAFSRKYVQTVLKETQNKIINKANKIGDEIITSYYDDYDTPLRNYERSGEFGNSWKVYKKSKNNRGTYTKNVQLSFDADLLNDVYHTYKKRHKVYPFSKEKVFTQNFFYGDHGRYVSRFDEVGNAPESWIYGEMHYVPRIDLDKKGEELNKQIPKLFKEATGVAPEKMFDILEKEVHKEISRLFTNK